MNLKNKYITIIYSGVIKNKTVRQIHKELYDATINSKKHNKYLYAFAMKLTNKMKKIRATQNESLAVLLINAFDKDNTNQRMKKIINHEVGREAEKLKNERLFDFIYKSRDSGKWFYLASSHNDCAKDHKDWQGKLYVDKFAPKDVILYAKNRGLYEMQWVIDSPVWFITRPNCRHYFVSLSYDEVNKKSLKKLKKKHHTHTDEGNREFQTPARIAVEEYEDRLKLLKSMYRENPSEILRKKIEKCELLLKKWKRLL